MRAAVWTPEMDEQLLEMRGRPTPLAWGFIRFEGFTKKDCQRRHRFLTEEIDRPQPRRAQTDPVEVDRDGLIWLIEKQRLTPSRQAAALAYRAAFRAVDGVTLPSSLGALDRVDGGGGDPVARAASLTSARRDLFVLRHVVLGGVDDLLTVMDGVCGLGHTLRKLAGGDSYRTAPLEAVLKVGLDLVHRHLQSALKTAA